MEADAVKEAGGQDAIKAAPVDPDQIPFNPSKPDEADNKGTQVGEDKSAVDDKNTKEPASDAKAPEADTPKESSDVSDIDESLFNASEDDSS